MLMFRNKTTPNLDAAKAILAKLFGVGMEPSCLRGEG